VFFPSLIIEAHIPLVIPFRHRHDMSYTLPDAQSLQPATIVADVQTGKIIDIVIVPSYNAMDEIVVAKNEFLRRRFPELPVRSSIQLGNTIG